MVEYAMRVAEIGIQEFGLGRVAWERRNRRQLDQDANISSDYSEGLDVLL